MAFQRASNAKVYGDSLDSYVSNLSQTLATQISVRNTADETAFNKAVLENNISLDDQLSYRKQQLKDVSDDPAERTRIKNEISALTNQIEQKKFSDAYLQKVSDFQSGLSSIDSVISFLTDQKADATDPTILDTINKNLSDASAIKFNLTKQLLTDSTNYALNDKSASVINTQIAKVSSAKATALLNGDEATSSMLDLQLQSLTKALAENTITNDVQSLAVSTMSGYSSATNLLDAFNAKIANSAGDGSVTVGGVTYGSAKEFWTYKRDSYVADQSDNGLFGRLASEADSAIKVADSKNLLTAGNISSYTSDIDSLAGRPELAGYDAKIAATKQGALQDGANLVADNTVNQYAIDYDITKATSTLSNLTSLGVNVSDAFTKIIVAGASVKQGQVNNILAAAQTALQNDPTLTPEAALQQALAAGAGTVLSPNDLTNRSESQIATDANNTAQGSTATNDSRTTIQQPTTPLATPAGTGGTDGTKSITVKNGETLSSIAARELGSAAKYSDLAAFNNIQDPNKIQAGQIIKIPGTPTAPTTPTTPVTPVTTTPSTPVTPVPTKPPVAPAPPSPAAPAPTPTTTPAPKSTYNGGSIVDYLTTTGKDSSFTSRTNLAKQNGISNYTGTADQNTQLLKTLRGF